MANRYWVGGSGTWDNASTANWSATSGGASGASAPTGADAVFFDANSGTGTVTLASTALASAVTQNAANITVQLNANNTGLTGISYLFQAGTLDLNNFALSVFSFISNTTSARTLAFGTSGAINISGNSATVVNLYNATTAITLTGTPVFNLTYSGGTGTRTVSSTVGSAQISVNITAGTDTVSLNSGFSYINLNFTGFSGTLANNTISNLTGNLTVSSGMTLSAGTGAMNFTGTSGTQQITSNGKTFDFPVTFNGAGGTFQLRDNLTVGATRTTTLTNGTLDLTGNSGNWTLSTGFFATSNTNTRSILFGTGNITLTGNATLIWNAPTLTGFTYTGTPTINCTYAGATGTRTFNHGATSGGSASNAVNVNVTAGTDTFTVATNSHIKNIDMTGWVGAFGNGFYCYGNFKMSASSTIYSGSGVMTFSSTGTQNITMNNVIWDRPVTFDGVGGTFVFQDAFSTTSTRTVTLTNGTLQLKNGVTSTVGALATSGTNQKVLQSTSAGSQATLSQASGTFNAQYLTVKDIAATGGAQFNALNNCITQGNNSGWYFAPQLGRPLPAFAF